MYINPVWHKSHQVLILFCHSSLRGPFPPYHCHPFFFLWCPRRKTKIKKIFIKENNQNLTLIIKNKYNPLNKNLNFEQNELFLKQKKKAEYGFKRKLTPCDCCSAAMFAILHWIHCRQHRWPYHLRYCFWTILSGLGNS